MYALMKLALTLPAIAALLVSTVQMGLLCALITFAGAPLYAPHFLTTAPWARRDPGRLRRGDGRGLRGGAFTR